MLRRKIVEFVEGGAFGLASGARDGGGYERLWFAEPVGAEEVAFEASVFLLTRARAEELRAAPAEETERPPQPPPPAPGSAPDPGLSGTGPDPAPPATIGAGAGEGTTTLRLTGTVPPETWNRLGTKVLPRLRSGADLRVDVTLSVSVASASAAATEAELERILDDLGLGDRVRVARS